MPGPSAYAMTADVPIDFETKAEMPLNSTASPRSFSSWNTSRLLWPTSQTRVLSLKLPTVETTPRNVTTINPREKPLQPPELASSHWSPQPPFARTQQTALAQTHISPMNDAVAIVLEANPYTIRDNNVPIDLARRIVVVEKRRTLLNMRVDVGAVSAFAADQWSLDSCRSRTLAADVRKYCRDPFGTPKNLVLCVPRSWIHIGRSQIRATTWTNSRSQTVRAFEK